MSLGALLRPWVGGFARPFWVLWAGTLLNMLGTMVEAFLGLYLIGMRGLSLSQTGLVIALLGGGSVASQLVGGLLADRIGRRATLALSTVATGAAILALGYAQGVAAIAAAALAVGLTREMYRPASAAIVADLVPPADRPRAYGLLYWAINLGWSVALVTGGMLARVGFHWLFWIDAATCVGFGLLVWRAVPETRPSRDSASREPGSFAEVLRDRLAVGYAVIVTGYTFVALQGMTSLPLAMRLDGLDPTAYGLAAAVNGIVVITVQPLVGGWLGRQDHPLVLAVGFTLVGCGYGSTACATRLPGYALTVLVWSLGEVAAAAVLLAVLADLAPPHLRGRYGGLYGIAWSGGLLLAPLGGTQLLRLGPTVLWVSCLGLAATAAAAVLGLGPAIRSRHALAAAAAS
ncbi:MAG: MFS transporter [Mycobacteriales bacterium]